MEVVFGSIAAAVAVFAAMLWATRIMWWRQGKNPFPRVPDRKPIEVENDEKKRDKVLRKFASKANIPRDVDAVIIGSGMGGLTTAVCLARAGKKVVVFEQHDVAGGCCHAFTKNGYEFDSGIHYVGVSDGVTGTFDILTDGAQEWELMDKDYDVCVIGDKKYPMPTGRKAYRDALVASFPDDAAAIDQYLTMVRDATKAVPVMFMVKLLPLWLVSGLIATGILQRIGNAFFKPATTTLQTVLDSLPTKNQQLKLVLSYVYGDYGTTPEKASFVVHAMVVDHYMHGAVFPVGGSGQLVYNMVEQIRAHGGDVLVNARVEKVTLSSSGAVSGVRLTRYPDIEINATTVVSDAGIVNTYKTLCPSLAAELEKAPLKNLKPGTSSTCLFVGLNGTSEQLELQSQNYWVCQDDFNELDKKFRSMTLDEVLAGDWELPGVFVSFPSKKDPNFVKKDTEHSTASLVALVPYGWFEGWANEKISKRGTEYEELKAVFSDKMWKQALRMYPQLENCVDYIEGATPLSCEFYLSTPEGSIYGIDHIAERFAPSATAALRPETPVPGLFITGQDVMLCGFAGAMYGGIFSASAILKRNLMIDLAMLKSKVAKRRSAFIRNAAPVEGAAPPTDVAGKKAN